MQGIGVLGLTTLQNNLVQAAAQCRTATNLSPPTTAPKKAMLACGSKVGCPKRTAVPLEVALQAELVLPTAETPTVAGFEKLQDG